MRIGICLDRVVSDWAAIARQLAEHGPPGAEAVDLRGWRAMPPGELLAAVRGCEVLVTGKHSPALPALADDPGRLRYCCHTRGVVKAYFPRGIFDRGIRLTNWGDTPARGVAQLAFTLLLAQILQIPARDRRSRRLPASFAAHAHPTDLDGFRLGLYGCGGIGRAMAALAAGVGMRVSAFDPWVPELPAGVARAASLDELCRANWAVSIHCGLGAETAGSLDARRLALLPDGAVVVNTARGGIVVESALAAETASGRLVAACDVIADESDWTSSPLAATPTVLLTGHGAHLPVPAAGREPPWSIPAYALHNLRAWAEGRPLLNEIDRDRYDRTT